MTFSSTVRHGKSTGSWNTIPTLRLGPLTRRPSSSTLPDEDDKRPPRIRSSVVLPQPDGPTIVTNSPSATSSVTSASARIREPARVRYVFSRRDTAISGAVILDMVRRGNYVRKGPLFHLTGFRTGLRRLSAAWCGCRTRGACWPAIWAADGRFAENADRAAIAACRASQAAAKRKYTVALAR